MIANHIFVLILFQVSFLERQGRSETADIWALNQKTSFGRRLLGVCLYFGLK